MNLKKSDKLIAIVGVVILIVAAITIVYYIEGEEPNEGPENGDELNEFIVEVSYPERELLPEESHEVKDKLLGDSPETVEIPIEIDNLKDAEIIVDYTDVQSGKLLKGLRDDTLTVVVSDEDGNEVGSQSIVGSGNATITISGGEPLDIKCIYAENIDEADAKLQENITETGEVETYTVQVSIKYKGLLERLRKDTFTIKAMGEYYEYDVKESEPLPDDEPDDELSQPEPDYEISPYKYLSYPGFH